jgi:hypothetical protein
MANWAIVTVVLYIMLVTALLIPVGLLAGGGVLLDLVRHWHLWWLVPAIILLAQLLMLVFPVRTYTAEPAPQRAIWVPVLTTAVLLLVLLVGLTGSIVVAIFGDDIPEPCGYAWVGGIIVGSWVVWSAVFYCFGRATDMPAFAQRLSRWLIRGSIVELLVAVPCHIVVRHRNDCCAPGITFFGISAGLAVMAIAFGPSVLLLVNSRLRQMRGKRTIA